MKHPQTIGRLVGPLASRTLGRDAAPLITLTVRWREIAGEHLARGSRPLALRRRAADESPTLHLLADADTAFLLAADGNRLLEDIAAFFGRPIAGRLAVRQGRPEAGRPAHKPARRAMLSPSETATIADYASQIGNPGLRRAICALGSSIYRTAESEREDLGR